MEISNFWIALLLTTLAGLSTGIGSLLVFFTKRTDAKFLSFSLGFSAGVMIYVSFVEILHEGQKILHESLGNLGLWICLISFFIGIGIIALIDNFIPTYENPHEMHNIEEAFNKEASHKFQHLHKIGILMAIAITIHNFPEGIVTFMATMSSVQLGAAIAFAVAIHNIPEGIAVAIPIYYSTKSKKKALLYSFLSGIAEPLGGLLGFLLLRPFMSDNILGVIFALIAGIMVFISLDSLLPSAEKYGYHHLSILGLVLGMAIMGVSLVMI
jgi:zinc transporter, ZIP family